MLFCSVLGASILTVALKSLFARPRPDMFFSVGENGFSFPSGHVLFALAFWGIVVYFLRLKQNTDDTGLKLILQQINELNRTVDAKIGENSRHMNDTIKNQLGESASLIREVTKGLTKLDETNKQVVSFADQL